MLREWFKLVEWQGPVNGTAMTALQAWGQYNAGKEPPPEAVFPARRVGAGSLAVEAGVPIMHLHGTPAEIGRQHGALQAANMAALKRLYLDRVFPDAAARTKALELSARMMEHAPPAYAEEIDAMGRASGLGPSEALLMQTFLDVMRGIACSTLTVEAEFTREGVPLFGRNLDFPGFGVAHRYNLLTVFHPAGRKAFAAFTWPGLAGALTGMNEDGLTLATMQVLSPWERLDAMPYILLYREILSACSTVGEAEELLRSARIGTTNNLMMMDATGATSVAELNRDGVQIRRPNRGGLFATNHFNARPHYQAVHCSRFETLSRRWRRDSGRMDADRMKRSLHAVHQGWLTLQAMVMYPSLRRAEFAFGLPPATERPWRDIDLAEHLGRAPAAEDARSVA
jgi:hypothetical protein